MTEPAYPGRDRGAPGLPRWVKVFIILAIGLAVAFVVTKLAGLEHGPGLHGPGGDGDRRIPVEQGT